MSDYNTPLKKKKYEGTNCIYRNTSFQVRENRACSRVHNIKITLRGLGVAAILDTIDLL